MTTISSNVTMKPTPPMATIAHAHPGTLMPVGVGVAAGVVADGLAESGPTETCVQHYNFCLKDYTKFPQENLLGSWSFRPR